MGAPDPQVRRPLGHGRHPASAVLPVLIGVNVAFFVVQVVAHSAGFGEALAPFELSAGGLREGKLWQLVSYMFLHSVENPMHILANMLMLYFSGREVEAIVGPRHLMGIYLLGGAMGGLAQVAFGAGPLIGASGGVFAVLLAFTTILPEIELTLLVFFVLPVRMKAKALAWGLVGLSAFCVATGFLPHWGHLAHLGGALVGWIYIKQMGFGNPLRIQRYFFEKRQQDERLRRMPPEQFVSEAIDPILDKISREGLHSLNRTERRILEKGRDKIARRTAGR